MAARIEFEREWLPKLQGNLDSQKKPFTLDTNKKSSPAVSNTKGKALNSMKSEGLKNLLDNL
jgi:hypothetical protein